MKTKVARWGNSLAIRVPAALAEEMALREGSEIDLSVDDGELKGRPVSDIPTLEELLASVTPGETHGEVDWGPPVGKEVW